MSLRTLNEKAGVVSAFMGRLGSAALVIMMLLTTVDVIGRQFNHPVLGALELTEYLVLIVILSMLSYTQKEKGHVNVDMLIRHFSPRAQAVVDIITNLLCLALMILITYKGFEYALDSMEAGESSPNLSIPKYPLAFFMVLCTAALALEYLRGLIDRFLDLKESNAS
jgi:TRAP-type transport system small permease protein